MYILIAGEPLPEGDLLYGMFGFGGGGRGPPSKRHQPQCEVW